MKIIGFEVDSIHCDKCVSKILDEVSRIEGVHKVDVIRYRRVVVVVEDDVDKKRIEEVIESLGYKVIKE